MMRSVMEYIHSMLLCAVCMMSAVLLANNGFVIAIVDVTHMCPESPSDVASVRVISDMPVSAVAYCRYGMAYPFVQVDSVTYRLNVGFSPNSSAQCQFRKKKLVDTYTLLIEVFQHDAVVLHRPQQRLITCAFGDNAQKQSSLEEISESKLPLSEQQHNKGSGANVTIVMEVWDSRNIPISNSKEFPIGKKIRILAEMKADLNAKGFQAISCEAVSTVTRGQSVETISYAILRGGCGDGNIIGKSEGFSTFARYSISPFFKAFRLRGTFDVRFVCNFTTCSDHCDGNSCINKNWRLLKRHNADSDRLHSEELITVATDYFTLSDELIEGKQSQEIPPIMLTYSSNSVRIYNPGSSSGLLLVGGMFSVLVLIGLAVIIILNIYIISVLYRHRFRRQQQALDEDVYSRQC